MRAERLALLCLIAVSLISANAMASPAEDAEFLVQEGIALRSKLQDVEALEKFQKAFEMARTPRIQAQIGAAEQALGRWAVAEVHLLAALEAASDAWIVKNRPTLDAALASVRTHLGSLEILGQPAGAEVRIDGEAMGRLPLSVPLRLPAGRTTLEVRAPGYFPVSRVVVVEAQTLTRESVALRIDDSATAAARPQIDAPAAPPPNLYPAPAQAPAPIPMSVATVNSSWRRPTELTLAGLALVSLTVGIVEHLRWQSKIDSFESMDACGASLPDRGGASCEHLYSDGHSARSVAFIGYGATAALGIAAAVLFFTESAREPEARQVACRPDLFERTVVCEARF